MRTGLLQLPAFLIKMLTKAKQQKFSQLNYLTCQIGLAFLAYVVVFFDD